MLQGSAVSRSAVGGVIPRVEARGAFANQVWWKDGVTEFAARGQGRLLLLLVIVHCIKISSLQLSRSWVSIRGESSRSPRWLVRYGFLRYQEIPQGSWVGRASCAIVHSTVWFWSGPSGPCLSIHGVLVLVVLGFGCLDL